MSDNIPEKEWEQTESGNKFTCVPEVLAGNLDV